MLNKEDEEYRKRKERAKQLRSIVNVNNETDTDYTAKKERAKELRNFAGMTTNNDKLDDEERIKQKMDKLWEENSQVSTQDISSLDDAQNKTAIQKNIIQNNIEKLPNINQGVKVQSQSTDKIPNYRNYNTTLPSVKNIPIIKSDMSNMTKATPMTISAIGEANQRNEEIKKGGYHSINATITSILKNIEGGVKSPAAGLVDAVTTLTALGVRGFETWAKIFNNERAENKLNDIYNNLVDSGSKIKEKGEYESNVTARINNTAIRTAGQVTNTITEMLTNQAIGMALGVDGTLMQGITVGGRSAQEVLDENEGHIGKATVTGVAKGYVSYLTEKMFDANILTRGKGGSVSDKVDELIYNTIKGKVGKEIANKTVGVIGENLEELVEDNVDNLIDKIINDKDFPEWKEWLNSTSETVKITSLSTIIMDLLGIGGGRFEDKESDIINRKMERKIQKIIDDGGLAIKYNDTINQEDIGQFYTTTFNQDGTLKDIEITSGKQIVNVNSKLNIKPVIIKKANTNIYNVIDGNTGLLLDNSPYTSTLSAEQWFDHKIINIDEAAIKGINSKVAKSNIALQNKIIEVANEAQQQLNHMPQKLTEQPQNSNIKNETTNYMGNVENNQNIENNKNRNMEDRTYENVSNKNVKPYSEEHPELSQDIKDMAANFMEDLEYSLPGKRYKAGDTWTGQKRSTTKELAEFKDATGVSWDKIRNILNDIYEGKGNYALAKKMEIELDKALTEGYQNIYGQTIMPNENYINKKGKIEGKSYRNDNTSSIDYDIEDSRIFGMKKNSSKSNYNKNVDTLNKQTNNYEDVIRSINNFKKAKRNIDRYDILNIANSLDIKLKPGAKLVNDTEMSKKAGNNIKPSIVNITDIFKNITDKTAKSFRSEAENIALELFRDIEVTIIDTNSITEINKSGIDKTFSGTVTESKIQTADNIKEIIEQGIYAFTSYNPTDKNKVLYHHFFAPVNYKGKNGLVRVVIKEFTKDSTVKDKFYYHQLEYIDNNKIEDINSALPQLNGNKDFELISSTNTISQDNKIVKSKTSVNNKNMQKIETIYRKFSKDFKEKGYVDLNNKTVKDIKEVADIAQIFRNPNYETFRMIYTRDNTIVGQEAISSRIPGQTKVFEDNNRAKGFYKIKNRMNRLNADGYYMVHNHPSGKAVASQIDINTTQLFIKNIPGFKGHVIVNSGTYATIERENGALSKLVANNEMVIENYKPDDIDKLISKEPWVNIKINSNKQIATLMHDVKNNPNYSTLILTDSQSYPRILLDIPNNFFNMSSSQIDGYIKNISKQNGATRAFIATTNNDVYKSSNKLTTITDSVLYSVKENEIYEIDTFSKHNEGITETKVFNNSNLKTKNTKQNTSNNDIRSLKKNNTEVDNLGRKLTREQQEFFKYSKVRNDNGNLMVMYHGTEANVGIPKEHWFNTFDIDKAGNHGNMLGNGFYFTSEKTHAEQYAHTKGNIYEVYLNIKKPLDLKNFSTGDLAYSIRNINPYIEADIYKKDGTIDGYKVREYLIKNGYDGIHSGNTYVAFYSNQIKNINNSNPTPSDDIRYLKKSATTLKTEKDNLGRSLSKQQQEYFKNSKVRDKNGNLLVVYHGTDTKFTVFNYDYLGKNGTANGKGFYLADDINVAKSYSDGKNLIEAYVDIQKPLSIGKTTITENDYIKFLEAVNDKTNGGLFTDYGDGEKIQKNSKQYNEIINQFKEEYKYGGDDVDLVLSILNSANITLEDGYRLLKNTLGYDGIIVETNYKNNGDTIPYTQYIPLIPEQIKNIDNTTPTDNPDIRYLQKTSKQNIPVDENIQKELHNRIQNAILSKNSRKNTFLGVVSDKVANKVKSLLGIDISGREHIITDYDIRHIIKQHGNPEIEKTKGQIAITSKDIEKIPDIINNYDKIVQGTDNKQGETIRYIKNYPDNKCYVVEVIPMANDTSLYIKTMWKKPVTLTNSNNTPSSTSETRGNLNSSTSTTSISQNPENVNNGKKVKTNIIDDLMNDIIQKSKDNFESDIKINSNIVDKEALLPLNYSKLKQSTLYNLAKKLFNNIHRRTFKNNNENIHVTNSDIDESIAQTLRNPNQKALLKENIAVFSKLDKIIESGIEIQSSNQPISDNKMRQQYSNYKYYYANVYIDGEPSIVQFDTRVQKGTTGKDERHFRLERIYKINEVDSNGGTDKSIIHFSNESTSTTSIPQNPENVNNSKKTADIEAGQRNAERADAYIEQEIKKIEATGEWDDSIPVTKMTDIRKSIEDYLGIGVQKGHFRQRAYGIYNTKTDSIRTKELKDMDSILHEVGHALDLGNRLEIDKESIADELLKAINKYGGYEGNPRSVLLDEGWAEVIREYAIIPEQAKAEYPQSVAVLEGIRANDKSFDKFISDTQQQIYNYIHQSPQNRVMSNLSVGEQTDKVPLTKKTLKEKIVKLVWDKDYALKAAVEELSNGKKLDPSQNAYILTRLASGVNNKAISIITNGYIDLEGNKTFGGLGKLGDILGNDEQRFNDLRAYLVAKRDLEYKAKTLKTGIRTMDSKAVVDKFKNDTQIQRAAKVVYDTLDGVLQYAVDNGLITRTDADILRQDNAFYVPFQRVIENNGNQVGKRGEVKNIIKRRTGSELDVKDVLENIVVNSVNIIKQVENNNILRALYKEGESAGIINNIFEKIPAPMKKIGTENLAIWEKELKNQGIDTDNIDLEKTIDIFVPDNKTDVGNRITSFIDDDGKRVYLQFSKDATDIFNTVMNLDSQTMSKVLKLNSVLNMPLRYGATMANIGFAIPNMISDTTQAMIYSEAGFIPVVDNALGVLDILTATNKSVAKFMNKVAPEYAKRIDALYTMYEQSGATSSTRMSQYRKSTQEIMRDVYGTKNSEILGIKDSFKPLKRLLDLMTYIPEISEQSTRFRVFEKNYSNSIAKGNTELDARIKAAIESRDATQDFGRTGNFTREINQLIPFSAARVGSAYTFAEKIKANPKATSMRIAILTAIAMGIQAIGYDDKEIEELNQRKKNDNFVLKIGDKVITIKKPQGILRSIVNLAEYIQDLATGHIEEGKEGERLYEWLNNAIMDNMPADEITGLVPNAVAPLIENAINKDFYYNTEIVKSYDLNLPDEEQYYDYNSQLAILLGKIFNYSPAKIDNLISGYLGGLGTQLTNIIDYVSGKLGINAEKPDMGIEQNSIGKRFVVNVNTNSASIDEIYTRRDELTKKLNGGTITADEEKELDKIKDAIKNLSNINKQIKAIKQDLTMSGKEKAEKIRPLQEQKTDTARQALGKELINSNNTSKIESTKFYPSNSTLKNNGYTLALTEKMKKEYENLAYEKYKQYKKQGLYSDEYLEKLETTCKEYAKKSLMQKYRNKLVKSK